MWRPGACGPERILRTSSASANPMKMTPQSMPRAIAQRVKSVLPGSIGFTTKPHAKRQTRRSQETDAANGSK